MEIARVECFCKKCGISFVYEKQCHNRLEAEQIEKKAARYMKTCTECYKQEAEKKAAIKCEELSLPSLEGSSEKQIQYAQSLRSRYVVRNEYEIRYAKKQLEMINPSRIPPVSAQWGLKETECVPEAFRQLGLEKAYICLVETRAKIVIDALR